MKSGLVAFALVGAIAVGAVGYIAGTELAPKAPAEAATEAAVKAYLAAHPELFPAPPPPAPMTPVASPKAPEPQKAELTDDERTEVEGIIKNYLIANPEVIREAMDALQRKEDAAAAAAQVKAIADSKDLIFSSSRQVVLGNPKGDVTLVEFFDYNCTYCRRAQADMKQLLDADKNLRIVLKEFPVLGEGSVEAAQVAVAVNMVAPEKYFAYHDAMLGERGQVNGERALAVAEELGIDRAMVEEKMKLPEVKATISEVYDLAAKLALSGTPTYVTTKEVIVGAVGFDTLKEKIDQARCGQPSC